MAFLTEIDLHAWRELNSHLNCSGPRGRPRMPRRLDYVFGSGSVRRHLTKRSAGNGMRWAQSRVAAARKLQQQQCHFLTHSMIQFSSFADSARARGRTLELTEIESGLITKCRRPLFCRSFSSASKASEAVCQVVGSAIQMRIEFSPRTGVHFSEGRLQMFLTTPFRPSQIRRHSVQLSARKDRGLTSFCNKHCFSITH